MKALAYWHGPARIHKLALAFAEGCRVHGVACDVLRVEQHGGPADLVWMYGMGEGKQAFQRHPDAVRIVGDKGYFHGHDIDKYFRVSVNAQQPDAHLRRRHHPSDRFDALGINVEPVTKRGEYVLLCGIGPKQCGIQGLRYGEWEQRTFEQLTQVTGRKVIVREKPKNPRISGLPRYSLPRTADAIRGAWAVVCLTGNIGVDAILHGVPVIAQAGPGSVYYNASYADIDTIEPISLEERKSALADVAYWQWRRDELSSGAFFRHLRAEGFA